MDLSISVFSKKTDADNLVAEAKPKGFDAIVVLRDGFYKVQIGTFSSKENAAALATKAKNAWT